MAINFYVDQLCILIIAILNWFLCLQAFIDRLRIQNMQFSGNYKTLEAADNN